MSPEPSTEVVPAAPIATELASGLAPSRNYVQAVELGKVLAASNYFPDARDAAKAAVKVMLAMDLGLSPTAGLMGIHTLEKSGRITFLIESKLLGAMVKQHPAYDYKVIERTAETCTLQFLENGEPIDDEIEAKITYSMVDAKRAGLDSKPTWKSNPRDMLQWRTLAEGVRLYFPDLLAGAPVYADSEFGEDVQELKLAEALAGPKAQPLTDAKAENLKAAARGFYDELKEVNPERMVVGRFASLLKGAEHSHASLENVVASLEDLRDTERELSALEDEAIAQLGVEKAKPLIERAERKGSNRERIESLRSALSPAEGSEGDEPAATAKGRQKAGESAGEGSK